ncbi:MULTISPECIES: ferredoxin [Saccharopolyspora]|uniref:Ferredoxin n=1 Tax=Saccharopolyspora elongata TaxID=2530387 RepID=A0A4R4YCS8_9PSEU|nr:ferredoxin [Saccharopolyspora elongata]TDD40982.1 ferredoxin [Saccharopolyspora elongata]
MKIIPDKDKCIGAGQCALIAADVFDQHDEDGRVMLLNPDPPHELLPQIEQAAAGCPALAITVQR